MSIGEKFEFRSVRGVTGCPIRPVWHVLTTAPQREAKCAGMLERAGVEVQYPTKTTVRHIRGKRREYVTPFVSQIIYARFEFQPLWHILKERRIISGMFKIGEKPVELTEDDIARVMGLPTEAERLEQERIDAERPIVGQPAELIGGPLVGTVVKVTAIDGGRCKFDMPSGVKGEMPLQLVRRVGVT